MTGRSRHGAEGPCEEDNLEDGRDEEEREKNAEAPGDGRIKKAHGAHPEEEPGEKPKARRRRADQSAERDA